MMLAGPTLMMVVIHRGPMWKVLLPRMLHRVMEVIERELLELVRISVPVGMGPLGIAMPFVMQHVLIKAVVRVDVRYVEMMRVVPFLVAGVPMRDLVFVVQVPGALILMRRSVRVLAAFVEAIVLVEDITVEMTRSVRLLVAFVEPVVLVEGIVVEMAGSIAVPVEVPREAMLVLLAMMAIVVAGVIILVMRA
jgi:hypothetical protein